MNFLAALNTQMIEDKAIDGFKAILAQHTEEQKGLDMDADPVFLSQLEKIWNMTFQSGCSIDFEEILEN